MDRYTRYAMSEKGKARSRRYKLKNKVKVKAQNRALYLYENQKCSIANCMEQGERHHPGYDRQDEVVILCRKHHLIIHGKVRGRCSICGLPQASKGLCKKHYAQKYRKIQGW
jgi:hypothetical protein